MALSKSVEESLKEAEAALRNALAYAASQEKTFTDMDLNNSISKNVNHLNWFCILFFTNVSQSRFLMLIILKHF